MTGLVLGRVGVVGLLGGVSVTGFAMAVFMCNAGGAWDNAKKIYSSPATTAARAGSAWRCPAASIEHRHGKAGDGHAARPNWPQDQAGGSAR